MHPSSPEGRRLRLKSKLTKWEARFTEKYQRAPAKSDIAKVPEVNAAYREYVALKKLISGSTTAVSATVPGENTLGLKAKTPDSRRKQREAAEVRFINEFYRSKASPARLASDTRPAESDPFADCASPLKRKSGSATPNGIGRTAHELTTLKDSPLAQFLKASLDNDDDDEREIDQKPRILFGSSMKANMVSPSAPTGKSLQPFGLHLNKPEKQVSEEMREILHDKSADTGMIQMDEENTSRSSVALALRKLIAPTKKQTQLPTKCSTLEAEPKLAGAGSGNKLNSAAAVAQKLMKLNSVVVSENLKTLPSVPLPIPPPLTGTSLASIGDGNDNVIAPGSFLMRSKALARTKSTSIFSSTVLKSTACLGEYSNLEAHLTSPKDVKNLDKKSGVILNHSEIPDSWVKYEGDSEYESRTVRKRNLRIDTLPEHVPNKSTKPTKNEVRQKASEVSTVTGGAKLTTNATADQKSKKELTLDRTPRKRKSVAYIVEDSDTDLENEGYKSVDASIKRARRPLTRENINLNENGYDNVQAELHKSADFEERKHTKKVEQPGLSKKSKAFSRPKSTAGSMKLSKGSKSDSLGNEGIGSSNYRTLNLQKSKFKKGGYLNSKGRFSKYTGRNKPQFSRKDREACENPWHMKDAEDMIHDIEMENERARLLKIPDLDFIQYQEDENCVPVSSTFFESVSEDAPGKGPKYFIDVHAALKSLTDLDLFRPGQLETINRILNGKSTILVLPTGGGKSLCYQLPAYILRKIFKKRNEPSVTLVISPMVSLMQDQIRCLPPKLKGVCLSSGNQSIADYRKISEQLANDEIDILFVTPERTQTEGFKSLVESRRISTIKFVCIDEVHCLTEWSHNFRTSYLSLSSILNEVIRVKCVLGLTATATKQARSAVVEMLNLPETAIVAHNKVRNNLKLTVLKLEKAESRDAQLEVLLKTPTFAEMSSIIIYTMFQAQADNVARFLRTRNFDAESYHAGKPSMERALIQEKFLQGQLKIIVATIAFGLGINKKDVRSVIHYNIPKSLENYMQEIGRSGRDGFPAFCHVFLNADDYVRHRSFAYSEGVDTPSVWRFILRVFSSGIAALKELEKGNGKTYICKNGTSVGKINGRLSMMISIDEAEKEFDMKESVLSTLLMYMENFEGKPIRVLPSIFSHYLFQFTKKASIDAAELNPVVASILKNCEIGRGKSILDTMKICSDINISPAALNNSLLELKKNKEIFFEGTIRSLHIELPNILASETDGEYLERMRLVLTTKMRDLESSKVAKLDVLYETLHKASFENLQDIDWEMLAKSDVNNDSPGDLDHVCLQKLDELRAKIHQYFEESQFVDFSQAQYSDPSATDQGYLLGVISGFRDPSLANRSDKCKKILRIDIHDFIVKNAGIFTSGRAIARVFHGISSPKFPAYEWYKNSAWNSYSHISFGDLVKLASKQLRDYRLQTGKSIDEEGERE